MARLSKAARERRSLERTAYHEAGHAVAAIELRRAIRFVSVVPKDDSFGHVLKTSPPKTIRPDINHVPRTERWVEREVIIGFAGLAAEGHFVGRYNHVGASADFRGVVDLASDLCGLDEVLEKYLDYMLARTKAFITAPAQWVRVEALAAELVALGELSARQAREVCRKAMNDSNRFMQLARESFERSEIKRLKDLERFDAAG